MKLEGNIIKGTFKARPNRFLALVEIAGIIHQVHVPTSGRMGELLIPENTVLLREVKGPGRKTDYELIMAFDGEILVSIDSRLPNMLILEAFKKGEIKEFQSYHTIGTESFWGNSRVDFLLSNGNRQCFVEVKSVTLVVDGVALFPDAPTRRGVKHMNELIKVRQAGFESAVIFVIQRDDAVSFSPNRNTDPEFADALIEAYDNGVQVIALRCSVDVRDVRLTDRVPVILE